MQGSVGEKTSEGVRMLINSIFANDLTMLLAQNVWLLHDAVRWEIVVFVSFFALLQSM